MKKIEQWIRQFVSERDLWVLRDKLTNKALNVSYSPEGLKYTTNKYGDLVYFNNAKLKKHNSKLIPVGDLGISSKVYVEKFIPMDHKDFKLQIAEYLFADKGLRLLYNNESIID